MDSVPPLRRKARELLLDEKDTLGNFTTLTTPQVAEALDLPTNTVRRVLEDLAAYQLVKRIKGGGNKPDNWHAVEINSPKTGPHTPA
jgi:predicted ArsR family transcriptional regulator